MTRIITIVSGSQGVGKTSLTTHLAAQLAQCGQRVCVLDADGGNVGITRLLGAASHTPSADAARRSSLKEWVKRPGRDTPRFAWHGPEDELDERTTRSSSS